LEQEDFLKRQIDQLGRVLGKLLTALLGFKAQGRISEGIESVDQALKTELGLNTNDLTLIPAESFLITLLDTKKFSDDNFEELAEIMFLIAEGLNASDTADRKMKKLYERALIIYEILDETSSTYSFDRHSKIGKIKKML
jgi:hypothetical protein